VDKSRSNEDHLQGHYTVLKVLYFKNRFNTLKIWPKCTLTLPLSADVDLHPSYVSCSTDVNFFLPKSGA